GGAVISPGKTGNVTSGPCQTGNITAPHRIQNTREYYRDRAAHLLQCGQRRPTRGYDDIGGKSYQFLRVLAGKRGIGSVPSPLDLYIATHRPAQFLQSLQDRRAVGLCYWIVRRRIHEQADPPHPRGLLRPHRHRPRRGRGAEEGEEG